MINSHLAHLARRLELYWRKAGALEAQGLDTSYGFQDRADPWPVHLPIFVIIK